MLETLEKNEDFKGQLKELQDKITKEQADSAKKVTAAEKAAREAMEALAEKEKQLTSEKVRNEYLREQLIQEREALRKVDDFAQAFALQKAQNQALGEKNAELTQQNQKY